ncbi:unnamed protein product, partial [Durusdinium trenchii]
MLLYLCSVIYVQVSLMRDWSFYRRASRFYEELVKDGTRETLACYDAEDWLAFCKAYFQKTCGLWTSLDLFEAFELQGLRRGFHRTFLAQAMPALLALLLVLYAPVLQGLVEPFRCVRLGDEPLWRSFFAPEVQCWSFEVPFTSLSFAVALLWAVGVPVVLSFVLRRVRNSLPDDFEFPPEYAVLSLGYRLGCWNWEMYIFLVKALLIGSSVLSPAGRSSFLFFLSILHGAVVRAVSPFTGRSDFVLLRWDRRFALFFVLSSMLVQALPCASSVEWVSPIWTLGLVLVLLLLNLVLLALLARDGFVCWHETYVERYEFYEWELWQRASSRCGPRLTRRLVQSLLNHYRRRVRNRAYVSFDIKLGWLTVCGSHGDQAQATCNWPDGSGLPVLLSEAPSAPPGNRSVRPSTLAQRQKVQKYLQTAAERLCLIRGAATFSVVELEFLIRAAFCFARRQELRRARLTQQVGLITREEYKVLSKVTDDAPATSVVRSDGSFLGLDALTLLWNSLDLDEDQGGRGSSRGVEIALALTGRRDWETWRFAGGQRSEEVSAYKPLSERLRSRYQAQTICESFFNDPGKVLFFYSRAEFIRQAELKKTKSAEQNRLSTIPTERAAALDYVWALLHYLGAVACDVGRGKGAAGFARRSAGGATVRPSRSVGGELQARVKFGHGNAPAVEVEEDVEPIIQEMFNEETFARGLDLEAARDAFHDRWFQQRGATFHPPGPAPSAFALGGAAETAPVTPRLMVEHELRKQQGDLKDQAVQVRVNEVVPLRFHRHAEWTQVESTYIQSRKRWRLGAEADEDMSESLAQDAEAAKAALASAAAGDAQRKLGGWRGWGGRGDAARAWSPPAASLSAISDGVARAWRSLAVGALYADVVSAAGPEEQEMPLMEPTLIDLQVPPYQALRTKRKVWNKRELLQAFCPQISITWVNLHASEVTAAVVARLYSCFEAARFYKRRGGFSLQMEEDQLEIARERTGKQRGVQSLRNALGFSVVLAVPQKSERRHSRMIARLGSEDPMGHGIAVEVAKRRANHVAKRASRSLGKRQQRIQRSRTALLADSAVPKERKNPVRSMLPVIAKAEDFVAGAKQVAKDAVRDTVKRSNEVFKELRKAAAAENVSREVEDMDELGQVARGLRAPGADALGLKENFGLALLPGWPVAQLQSAFRHRARQCT